MTYGVIAYAIRIWRLRLLKISVGDNEGDMYDDECL